MTVNYTVNQSLVTTLTKKLNQCFVSSKQEVFKLLNQPNAYPCLSSWGM